MSGASRGVVAIALGLLIVGAAAAQVKKADPLEDYKARMTVAAQQIETEVRDAVTQAQKLLPTKPADAAALLRKVLARVEDDKFLTETRRTQVKRDLKDRILLADANASRMGQRDEDRAAKSAVSAARQAQREQQEREADQLAQMLASVRELQKQGKTFEAARLADEIARRYPDNPAAAAGSRTTSTADRVTELRELNAERERRMVMVMRDIERSSMPPVDDITFPRDWKERTKMRGKDNALTENEKAILRALETPIDIDLKDAKFEDVIDYLEKRMGITIVTDKLGLDQSSVSYDTPVTVKAKKVAAKTVLRKVLNELSLAYVVKDETIQVTSAERAKSMLTTRAYYMGDLLGIVDNRWGPWGTQAQIYNNVVQLMAMITQGVDTDSWQVNERGGFGTITFHPPTMSFVIKQSAEVHYSLRNSFR